MNINWYDFFHRIRTISGILLILGLYMWPVFGDQDGLFDTSGYIPYLVITFAVTMFSWLMLGKYKSLRNIPDTTTKKTGKLYGIIGISLILAFLLLYTFFVKVNQP